MFLIFGLKVLIKLSVQLLTYVKKDVLALSFEESLSLLNSFVRDSEFDEVGVFCSPIP